MIRGADLSDYNLVDSFHMVKASGLDFVVCKATEGVGNVQDTFADYTLRARSVGLVVGAYHFLNWTEDPVRQAEHFLGVYKPQNGDLPPVLDCEACTVDSTTAIMQIARFVREVEPYLNGSKMLLYMSYSFPQDHLAGGSGFSGHDLWVAAYEDPSKGFDDVTPAPWRQSQYGGRVVMWQYTDALSVPGISGAVDGDLFNGSLSDLHAYTLKGL